MSSTVPHFLLFSESSRTAEQGRWRFVLQSLDGENQIEAMDSEPGVHGERLELLAAVRGLEAVPEPARITLVTPSRYVNRGLSYGLSEWRSNDWQWERFGEMAPIKNRDLWQRVDRALKFHVVDCRLLRFDRRGPDDDLEPLAGPHFRPSSPERSTNDRQAICLAPSARHRHVEATQGQAMATFSGADAVVAARTPRRRRFRRRWVQCLRTLEAWHEGGWLAVARLGTQFLSPPWLR